MESLDKSIRGFEPLMHKILHKYKIKKADYKDYLQELRVVAWRVLEKYDKKRGSLTTIMQVAMQNRLKNIIRDDNDNYIYLEDLGFRKRNKALSIESISKSKIAFREIKDNLSNLEKKIVELYLQGMTQKEIGELLGVSRLKVQRQMKRIISRIKKQKTNK